LTGGFIAKNRLRIELYGNLKKFKTIETEETTKLNDVRCKLEEVSCRINNVMKDLQQAQTKISRLKFDEIRLTLTLTNENLNVLKQSVESKQTLIRRIEASKKSVEAKIVALDEELQQVFLI
jgi:ABC-type ATPase with predicted acetyltransferase domain